MKVDPRQVRLVMELRQAGIQDTGVLAAIERTPRELFVPTSFQEEAYENTALPIECGQTISQPLVVALMTAAIEPGKRLRVLEIGTGSGYQTAVLTQMFRRVYTIERYADLLQTAQRRFDALGLHSITTRLGDGARGWPEQAPFDRILVTAGAERIPPALLDQLADGGVLVIPIGITGDQNLVRIRKIGETLEQEDLGPVRFVPLVAEPPVR
ncbi:MAG: protein-L-isoaspartate(D-aspartate) O-methyltransferase [Alphaproteobacteria bacterium]|nr:protein-L-isoaspartate(D-aspartate) O-methyltransferase [Alphaproteobacteria bacterium]